MSLVQFSIWLVAKLLKSNHGKRCPYGLRHNLIIYCHHMNLNRGCIDIFWLRIHNVRCPRTLITASHYKHTETQKLPVPVRHGKSQPPADRIPPPFPRFLSFFSPISTSPCYLILPLLLLLRATEISHACQITLMHFTQTRTLHIKSWIVMTKYIYTLQFCDVLYTNASKWGLI